MGFKPQNLGSETYAPNVIKIYIYFKCSHQNKNRQKISISAFFLFNRIAKQKKSLNTSFYKALFQVTMSVNTNNHLLNNNKKLTVKEADTFSEQLFEQQLEQTQTMWSKSEKQRIHRKRQ